MKDVAAAAGVHQTTVSLVFRNAPRISKATKDHVRKVAEELGYRKNPLLSVLMANRIQGGRKSAGSKVVYTTSIPCKGGWLKFDPLLPDYYAAAATRMEELGFQLERCDFSDQKMSIRRLVDILRSRGIHGLMVAPMPESIHLRDVDLSDHCVITLGRRTVIEGVPKASSNQGYNMLLALEKCHENGFTRVGVCLITGRQWEGAWDSLLGSYLARNFRSGAGYLSSLPPFLSDRVNSDEFSEWFHSTAPEVIVTNKPTLVRNELKHMQINIPRDIGLISLCVSDDEKWIAGINPNHDKIANSAATQLVGMITRNEFGIPSIQHEILIMGTWTDGSSFRSKNKKSRAPRNRGHGTKNKT